MSDGLVAGRFRLRGLLGSGGTAAVFAADDTQAGGSVALKLLHPHLATERRAWDAFFEEVRAAQSISHPGLVEVRDAGIVDADPPVVWIAMELVEGVSLDEHVRAAGPLTPAAAVAVCDAVLAALEAAHAGGVVHRDVSPSNISLDPALLSEPLDAERLAASVRLLDFGLADIPGRSTVGADALLSGAGATDADAAGAGEAGVVANASYASPEQLAGAAVDERSDLYQVGACLYFALTGRAPFTGSVSAMVHAHLTAPPPVPSVVRRGIPRPLDRVVTASMLKRPNDRYADAGAMRAALALSLGGVDVAPAPHPQTGVTKVYRTATPVSAHARVPARAAPEADAAPRSGGIAWVLVGVAIVALTAIAGVSAMGASSQAAPSPSPTAPSSEAPTAAPATPPATRPAAAQVPVPELAGQSLTEARDLLSRAGLALGEVATEDSASVEGIVLGSSPHAGESAAAGSAVAVRVASGRNVVPPVAGLSVAEASALLAAAGFAASNADPAAAVTATDPVAGATASVGSIVTLTVAAPSPSPSPSATPTPAPSPTSTGAP